MLFCKEKFSKIKNKAKVSCAAAAVGIMATSTTVLAAGSNKYAKNASDWLLDGVQTLVLVGAAGVIGMFIVKRKFVQMIVSLIIAAIIVAVVFNPMLLKTIGDYLVGVLFG